MKKEVFKSTRLYAYQDEQRVTTVVFNNPERLNAFDLQMTNEAYDLYSALQHHGPRVVVFRGEGRAFSAGGDLELLLELTTTPSDTSKKTMRRLYDAFLNLARLDCPTIAMLNGPAVGAGFCFALACDMRYIAGNTKVGLNFVKIGLSPGMAAEYFGLRTMPRGKLTEMITTGKIYLSDDLKQFNVFEGFFNADELEAKTYATAKSIADNSKQAIGPSLAQLRDTSLDLETSLENEAIAQTNCFLNGEMKEAIQAQKEKQAYRFTL